MREDVKMSRCERRKCEDEKMFRRCEDEKMFYRPPLLEEPCAQTLSGKKSVLQKIISQRPEYIQTPPHARGEIPWLMGRYNGSLREKDIK